MGRFWFWGNVIKLYGILGIKKIIGKWISIPDSFNWLDRNYRYPNYAGKQLMTPGETQEFIVDCIQNGTPFAAARSGMTEMYASIFADGVNKGYLHRIPQKFKDKLCYWCGFFPNEQEAFCRYSQIHQQSLAKADVLGICRRTPEQYFLKSMHHQIRYTYLYFFDPFYYKPAWTRALKGKKVLIVHPFQHTIEKQYKKREFLFKDPEILPEFQLTTFKAVQTIGGEIDSRFQTWFDALDYMTAEIKKLDFDIALLGCGAYGLPLSIAIKEMGKQSVYLGGSLQLLFGIKGSRWKNHPILSKLYNEFWVYPDAVDIPQNADKVEGGCYW